MSLIRIAPDGRKEQFEPPTAPAALTAPAYRSEIIDLANSQGDIRSWNATVLIPAFTPKPIRWITTVIPRRSGEVWIGGRESSSIDEGTTLVRYARGAPAVTPVLLRTPADEQNAIRNARAIRTGLNRCVSLFVPFPRARRDAAAEPNAFYEEHKAEIDAAVAKSDSPGAKTDPPMEVAIIDGRLEGRHVGGALFIRSDPAADEDRMLTAVRRIVELATPDPASPPAVSCSVPELDRIIARLRVAKPKRY